MDEPVVIKMGTIERDIPARVSEKRFKVRFAPDPTTLQADQAFLPRLVEKSGACNVESRTVTGKKLKFLNDIFTTFVDTPWRFLLPIFSLTILLSWLFFASVFYAISAVHGDFERIKETEKWVACVENTPDFINMLMFSMETQTTIGYGTRYVNDECPAAVFSVMVQSIIGALLQALLTGMVIAKVQKPKKRANTILFSRNVCISEEEGDMFLSIRVGDLQRSDMIDTHAHAVCVRDRVTNDGEFVSHFRYDMDFSAQMTNPRISLRWPVTLRHRITPSSPFWNNDEDDLRRTNFEVIVFLQGTIESTGMMVQTRTSYLPSDFLWDRKFKPMMAEWKASGSLDFDYSQFHDTIPAVDVSPSRNRKVNLLVRSLSPTDSCYGTESGNGEGCNTDSTDSGSEQSTTYRENIHLRKISDMSQDISSLSD
ncbi:ATP-sensitive inward rectifier potassium channel 12-like [Argopecten irradians]|uniref:ATP-sensitive inward rectifier potassium channel 12-like n=1 Tax=Argopecten irradians TaxID=31199 RepID=UPI003711DCC4